MDLNLKKPLAFFDIESTGLNVAKDRIIELSILKIETNNNRVSKTWVVNPAYPISEEASAIHGFTYEDVKDKPQFKQVAKEVDDFLANCDLAGYNSLKFDIPMLVEEFLRADVDFDVSNRKLIDVQNIFMKMEQRTLSAAVKFFLGKTLEDAHSAEADVMATYEVLKAQIEKYEDVVYTDKKGETTKPVKNDIKALADF
ncbi:MAG: DNA polymerase III subunit epsilon, partial [Marinilabiliales bacterium]